jgi:hypothetical protein
MLSNQAAQPPTTWETWTWNSEATADAGADAGPWHGYDGWEAKHNARTLFGGRQERAAGTGQKKL